MGSPAHNFRSVLRHCLLFIVPALYVVVRGASATTDGDTVASFADRSLNDIIAARQLRRLQQPFPPVDGLADRPCNEVFTTVTTDEVTLHLEAVANAIFPPTSAGPSIFASALVAQLGSGIEFDFHAVKVCLTCDEAEALLTQEQLTDDHPYGFPQYCGNDVYGNDAVHSALVFVPVSGDDDTPLEGLLRGTVNTHSTFATVDLSPTSFWPDSLATFIQESPVEDVVGLMVDYMAPMAATSAGAITIIPDYIGYGQSSGYNRTYSAKESYMQSSVLAWLATQEYVSSATNGCTQLDDFATVNGYSEGGYASICASIALNQIGVTIRSLFSGAAPLQPEIQMRETMDKYENTNNPSELLDLISIPFLGYAWSNDIPLFANANMNQHLLADEWRNTGNITTDVILWFISGSTVGRSFFGFLPQTELTSIYNTNLRNMFNTAREQDISTPCDLANSTTDLLCKVMRDGSLVPDMETYISWPTSICHSPDDTTVSIENVPDLPLPGNDNVALYQPSSANLAPTGDHATAFFTCVFGMILSYQDTNNSPVARSALPDPATCTPDGATSSPTAAPTPDSGSVSFNDGMIVAATAAVMAAATILIAAV